MIETFTEKPSELVGLIPAAGQATRLGPLPFSKELYPVTVRTETDGCGHHITVAGHYLIERIRHGGATRAFVVLRPGKWDIPQFFGDGSCMNLSLAYLIVHVPFGVPFSLDQAFPFVQSATILFGFPDILFEPRDAFLTLLHELDTRDADVVLGLFRTDEPHKVGLVDFTQDGWVTSIHEKSQVTHLEYMWAIAVWKPTFTAFLHRRVTEHLGTLLNQASPERRGNDSGPSEFSLSDVLHSGVASGLRVAGHRFDSGTYVDIGTPDQLAAVIASEC